MGGKNKAKILLAYHRPTTLIADEIYTPIHAGRQLGLLVSKDGAVSQENFAWLTKSMIGDNTGENISALNRRFAELTPMYWAWKNYQKLGSPDYIGLMHYHRFFGFNERPSVNPHLTAPGTFFSHFDEKVMDKINLTSENIEKIMSGCDMILPGKVNHQGRSNIQHYLACPEFHIEEDIYRCLDVVKNKYPYMQGAVDEFAQDGMQSYGNMFVMHRELFFEYASFVFNVVFYLDSQFDYSKCTILQLRRVAYLSERLLDIFGRYVTKHAGKVVYYLPMVVIRNSELSSGPTPTFNHSNIPVCNAPVAHGIFYRKIHKLIKHPFRFFGDMKMFKKNSFLRKLRKLIISPLHFVRDMKVFKKNSNPQPSVVSKSDFKKLTNYVEQISKSVVSKSDFIKLTNSVEQISKAVQQQINAAFLHSKVFPKYKNIHNGQDIVLLGAGPSLDYYKEPIEGAIHCAVNLACLCSANIVLDYYFTVYNKWAFLWDTEPKLLKSIHTKKFYGMICGGSYTPDNVQDAVAIRQNAERYFVMPNWRYPPLSYTPHIDSQPLGCPGSIIFSALQFLLYTNPKRIYLVGCDTTSVGHFSSRDMSEFYSELPSHVKEGRWASTIVVGWYEMKKFIELYYSEIEIISVNPVHLEGLFDDQYTVNPSNLKAADVDKHLVPPWKI